jgi:anti-sigma factor RsiW
MTDYEILMMDAIDGTLAAGDRARLDAYLAANPEARAQFEAMTSVDMALKADAALPLPAPPAALVANVMQATQPLKIYRSLNTKSLAVIISTNAVLLLLSWVLIGGIVVSAAWVALPPGTAEAVAAMARAASGLLGALSRVGQALLAQPFIWAASVLGVGLVAAWVTVLSRLFGPTPAFASRRRS